MPQNQSISKFSSFIGVILLLGVISFTVLINFEKIKKMVRRANKAIEVENHVPKSMTEKDLENLWKLKNLNTDSININYNKHQTTIRITKSIKTDITTNKEKQSINYGTLLFEHFYAIGNYNDYKFETVSIYGNSIRPDFLRQIGDIFLKYQINSITTELENFTRIELKNGGKVFLIKGNIEVKDNTGFLEEAKFLNDSTKLYGSLHIE